MSSRLLMSFMVFLSFPVFSQVQLKFITTNAYGNNLYLDNLTLGTKFNTDISVIGLSNIIPDTSYTIGTASFSIAPKVIVVNMGSSDISASSSITLSVTPGVYSSTKSVASIGAGQGQEVTFDILTITPGLPINITVSANLKGDQNLSNNSFSQYSAYFPGVERKLLLEEFTSSTCAPCASNNPTIDAFVSTRFDSLTAIKYHMNWPSPGNDPMYYYNPTQNTERRNYYGVTGVPTVVMDGIINPSYPYSTPASLPNAYYPRKGIGSPVSITVVNSRIGSDSLRANISVQILAPLPYGQYYLRVAAVERHIKYTSAPGSNGEKDFYDVFRKAYPTTLGTLISTSVGTYQYTFTYAIDKATWVDSMIYTSAFIQNDLTKEIINSGKSRNYAELITVKKTGDTQLQKQMIAEDFIISTDAKNLQGIYSENFSNTYFYDIFEGTYPPSGWTLKNPDGGITFSSYTGANGPSIAGNKSIIMRFYDYSASNQKDTLTTKIYTGLLSSDSVKFDYAYAPYSGSYPDRLTVKMSIDGGITFPYTIFDKAGSELATTSATTNSFAPTLSSQWKTTSYALDMITIVEIEENGSFDYSLLQNYPNPFNPETIIKFSLPAKEVVKLEIFNSLGEKVSDLVNGVKEAGSHEIKFTATNLPSGIYLYRLQAGSFMQSKKLLLIK
ncbi:MAG: T9SS type A sorting domain-containing protein [Ignavibacteriaceae bacterium]